MAEPKATICPNCQQPAIRTGNEIACETCDATFVITKKQGAKVKQIGISERIDLLEKEVFAEKSPAEPESEPIEPEPTEPDNTPEDEL